MKEMKTSGISKPNKILRLPYKSQNFRTNPFQNYLRP